MSKVIGSIEGIIARLEQSGERAVKGVSDVLQNNAVDIRDTAIEFAPIDTGALEKSIKKNTTYTGQNRRAVVEIYVDESTAAGKYAAEVHENLAPFGSGSWGTVGGSDPKSKSAIKDNGRGVVGGKFLTRAFLLYVDKIKRESERIVSRAMKR